MADAAHSNQDAARVLGRLVELERRLHDVEGELDAAQRFVTLGAFAGAIAHEVNNILTPVLNYARLASEEGAGDEIKNKALAKAIDGAERATRISDSILGVITDNGEQQADVTRVVRQTLDCLGRDPVRSGIEIRLEIDKGCKAAIAPACLQQVMLNLVMNSIRVLGQAGVGGVLTISAVCFTWHNQALGARKAVRIRVVDNGPGISEEVRDRLFLPGVRGGDPAVGHDRSKSESASGAGLGLAICRRLIEAAGGKISVDSPPGKGAVFTVVLLESDASDANQAA